MKPLRTLKLIKFMLYLIIPAAASTFDNLLIFMTSCGKFCVISYVMVISRQVAHKYLLILTIMRLKLHSE